MKMILMIIGFISISACDKKSNHGMLREGDIIFQISKSTQSSAIQLATGSKYSHCGIVVKINNQWKVIEAVQPVKTTDLDAFIKRGKSGLYVIKRVAELSDIQLNEKRIIAEKFIKSQIGKPYDLYFNWDDSQIYCSELVWKFYHEVYGIDLGKLQKMKEFNLKNKKVQMILYQRYGNKIPFEEKVISPVSIFNDKRLKMIESN